MLQKTHKLKNWLKNGQIQLNGPNSVEKAKIWLQRVTKGSKYEQRGVLRGKGVALYTFPTTPFPSLFPKVILSSKIFNLVSYF